jgi:hypothetical protein
MLADPSDILSCSDEHASIARRYAAKKYSSKKFGSAVSASAASALARSQPIRVAAGGR